MLTIYGIKNCGTIKETKEYFDKKGIEYQFHDHRLDGLDKAWLEDVMTKLPWDKVVNKRSTTYRHLTDEQKQNLSEDNVVELLLENPTLIKRPIIQYENGDMILGFFPKRLDKIFV
jgi:Spx/MgsR family transcriptional regulator